jgi:hypothetical protein
MPFMKATEIEAAAARTIAAGMREMSIVDGAHPGELALIEAFEADIPEGAGEGVVDLDALSSPELKEAFLKSLALVALVDGELTVQELDLLRGYADPMGLSDEQIGRVVGEVSEVMLSVFSGVKIFRHQAESIGRTLGLDDRAIARALGE